jgi:hypothetical protein
MMSYQSLTALSVGKVAWDWLAELQPAYPLGATKRGAFFQLDSGGVIFLSLEPFCGPLTINLEPDSGECARIARSEACVSQEAIDFKQINLTVSLRSSRVWEAAVPEMGRSLPTESRERNIARVIARFLDMDPRSELACLLPYLKEDQLPESLLANPFWPRICRLKESVSARAGDNSDMNALAGSLGDFLGLGPGLTPSGDDFVMGFLLALNRWGQVLFPGVQPEGLNQALADLAARKTTTLSASLIACSAQGQADERLVRAFDGIMTGELDPRTCERLLSGWGSSSGLDALAGFIIGHLLGGSYGEG